MKLKESFYCVSETADKELVRQVVAQVKMLDRADAEQVLYWILLSNPNERLRDGLTHFTCYVEAQRE